MATTMSRESYLKHLKRGLSGISRGKKQEIVDEIGLQVDANLALHEDPNHALMNMENPKRLGKALRAVHGIAWWRWLVGWVVALVLGLLAMPLDSLFGGWNSTLFLVLLLLWVLRSGARGGRIHGLVTGVMGAGPRIVLAVGVTAFFDEFNEVIEVFAITEGAIAGLVLTSLLLPLFGFFAGGRIKQ